MEMIPLKAQARTEGKTLVQLRKEDFVPCIIYGNGMENLSLQCNHNELMRAYVKAGESTLVELDTGTKKIPVLFHAISLHPVNDRMIHADFYAVNMKKEIEAHVPIEIKGEPPAVKDFGGIVITVLDHVTVKCLPADLPHSLTLDISTLAEIGEHMTVGNIAAPANVKIMTDADQMVVSIQEPRRAEEEAPVGGTVEGEGATEGTEGEGAKEGGENNKDEVKKKEDKGS